MTSARLCRTRCSVTGLIRRTNPVRRLGIAKEVAEASFCRTAHTLRSNGAWEETAPNYWGRPLDPMERWVRTNAVAAAKTEGREDYTINIFVRTAFDPREFGGMTDFVDRLKQAWVALRARQPMLASYAVDDRRVCCLSNKKVHLESWLRDSFFVVHDSTGDVVDESSGDGAHTAYGHFAPTKHAALYFFPETKDILIRCPHYLMDGIGHLMLLHHLLSDVSKREPVEESQERQPSAHSLSPPLERAVNLPVATPSQRAGVKDFVDQFLAGSFPPMGLPMRSSLQGAPGTPRKTFRQFSLSDSADLLAASRRLGCTITHAAHAAAMVAAYKHGQLWELRQDHDQYCSGTTFDFRHRATPPFNSNSHACSLYILPRFVVLRHGNFNQTLSQMRTFYRNEWKKPDLLPSVLPFLDSMNQVSDAMAAADPAPPPTSNVNLSSFGRLEPHVQRQYGQGLSFILVNEVSIQGEFVTPSVIIQVWSFNDRLTMQMEWNDKYYDNSDMDEYFRLVVKELRTGLHLERAPPKVFDLPVSPVSSLLNATA
ncbi:MAG: hypothetical protein LQ348_004326 [Seirophora lacunosa]|nr:MAG: hypothetical protein LQ348_004326 [Seirophora lacunosa]